MTPNEKIVALLLLLQAVSAFFLWTLDALGAVSEGKFAVFLAVDLLAFTLTAYVYTHEKWGEATSRVWILAGSLGLMILLFVGLYFP
jgi:uncharacterized membrane protein YozB (DUF420 family)